MHAEAAAAEGRSGYKISLQYPSYASIVDYADDRALRQQLYRAYSTRASDFGRPDWNNGPLMIELLKLRRAHAELLGYRNYGEISLSRIVREYDIRNLEFGIWNRRPFPPPPPQKLHDQCGLNGLPLNPDAP